VKSPIAIACVDAGADDDVRDAVAVEITYCEHGARKRDSTLVEGAVSIPKIDGAVPEKVELVVVIEVCGE
jgi:hypothetical protein